jgi:hypothetical protein
VYRSSRPTVAVVDLPSLQVAYLAM